MNNYPYILCPGEPFSATAAKLDAAISSLIAAVVQNDGTRLWSCVVCGKTGRKNDVIRHVEALHLNHPGIACPECGKISKTRNSLRNHVYSVHKRNYTSSL
jgi:uncharacterized C2H2 Zn-finger protein